MLDFNLGFTGTVAEYKHETGADIFVTLEGKQLKDDSYLCSSFILTEAYSTDLQEPAIALLGKSRFPKGDDLVLFLHQNKDIKFIKYDGDEDWTPIEKAKKRTGLKALGSVMNMKWYEQPGISEGVSFEMPNDDFMFDSVIENKGIVMDDCDYEQWHCYEGNAEKCVYGCNDVYRFGSYEECIACLENGICSLHDLSALYVGGNEEAYIDGIDTMDGLIADIDPAWFPKEKYDGPGEPSDDPGSYEVNINEDLRTYKLKANEIRIEKIVG